MCRSAVITAKWKNSGHCADSHLEAPFLSRAVAAALVSPTDITVLSPGVSLLSPQGGLQTVARALALISPQPALYQAEC